MLGYLYLYRQEPDPARRDFRELQKLAPERAEHLGRMMLPWDRVIRHGNGMTALAVWAVIGVIIDVSAPLNTYACYWAMGGIIFVIHSAMTVRLNPRVREAERSEQMRAA